MKEDYYIALRKTQSTLRTEAPDWQPWLMFFMQAMKKQKYRLEKKLDYERSALYSNLPELALQILDYAQDHGRVTRKDMVHATGASPNTLKSLLSYLVSNKFLDRHGGGRSIWYTRSLIRRD